MASIFAKIIAGEIPSYKIYEDERYFSFLDIRPMVKGHTLVIPKMEVDYIFDLDDETYSGLFRVVKKISIALKQVVPCEKVGMAVVGLEVPHTHVHLMPIEYVSDMSFKKPPLVFSAGEMKDLAAQISARIS